MPWLKAAQIPSRALPWNPTPFASLGADSHVEKHDVRMGHPKHLFHDIDYKPFNQISEVRLTTTHSHSYNWHSWHSSANSPWFWGHSQNSNSTYSKNHS